MNSQPRPFLRLPPSQSDSQVPNGMAGTAPPTPKKRPCLICLESFDNKPSNFPHKCPRCNSSQYCLGCLKSWFLDACRNEAKMPPKCCTVVPLSAVKKVLTGEEIELYKAKFEEWSTPGRLYCPVPACSAFISPRLYVKPKQSSIHDVVDPELPTPAKIDVTCPKCSTSVCTECRSLAHMSEDCPTAELDPGLEEVLKKWKINRCPKCRTGVRKMFGCAHVECRCGAHFCYQCLRPVNQCNDEVCDEEAEQPDSDIEDDDIDGHAGFYEGDGHEFGPEPEGDIVEAWECNHMWSLAESTALPSEPECHICFRTVHAPEESQSAVFSERKDTEMSGTSEPLNDFGEPAWQCYGRHRACQNCSVKPPSHRTKDPTRMWNCDCGMTCIKCDKAEAMEKFWGQDEGRTAWLCHCEMIVCGECKNDLGLA